MILRLSVLLLSILFNFTGIAQVSVFVQVVLGVAVVNRDKIEYPAFHAFYGFVAIIAIAIIYSYRAQLKSKMYLLYGFVNCCGYSDRCCKKTDLWLRPKLICGALICYQLES